MEIQNKEEQNTPELTEDSLQDTSAKQEEAEIQEETESQEEQNPSSNRRFLLWTLAGIYLLYTGYSLCKNVIQGAEGASTGFLLAGIAAGASMQIFQYPKPSLLNYLDVFLAVTASLLGIFGWRFLSLNLLSGALYLILFFLLLFSGAAKILPSEVLPVFLLPAVLLSGHAIFLQRQKSSDSSR